MCFFFPQLAAKAFHTHLQYLFGPLNDVIGQGDSGTVYRVILPEEGRAALKVAKGASQALKKEFDNANMIPPHDNLIKYLQIIPHEVATQPLFGAEAMDIDDEPGGQTHNTTLYAVLLELAEGGSLQGVLKSNLLTEEQAGRYLRDVLLGLKHIHEAEFMHLDIKPENIFLSTPDGTALIGDLGQLVAYGSYQPHQTSEGDSKYLAPELLGDVRPPVHAPDIFSLGVTLLECVTELRIPENGHAAYGDLRNERYPEEFMSTLSPPLQALIRRMLTRDPTRRPTAAQLLADPFFTALPPPTPDSRRRKSRSTSTPSTPMISYGTHYVGSPSYSTAVASSAPGHGFIGTSSHQRNSSLGEPSSHHAVSRQLVFGNNK